MLAVFQAEVYDLEGMTVDGHKHLCERFGLCRNWLCGDSHWLFVRKVALARMLLPAGSVLADGSF